MIGRMHHVVIDCPDPAALATFYSELLGLPVTYRSAGWVVIAKDDMTSGVAFQLAPDHQPPEWPNPGRLQQVHLDVIVDDLAAAELGVTELRPSNSTHRRWSRLRMAERRYNGRGPESPMPSRSTRVQITVSILGGVMDDDRVTSIRDDPHCQGSRQDPEFTMG